MVSYALCWALGEGLPLGGVKAGWALGEGRQSAEQRVGRDVEVPSDSRGVLRGGADGRWGVALREEE